MNTSTFFALMAEFNTASIPLELVCEKYFGLNFSQAKRKANTQELPIPCFKGRDSQKCTWLVSSQDLAEHIDQQRKKALADHKKMNGIAA